MIHHLATRKQGRCVSPSRFARRNLTWNVPKRRENPPKKHSPLHLRCTSQLSRHSLQSVTSTHHSLSWLVDCWQIYFFTVPSSGFWWFLEGVRKDTKLKKNNFQICLLSPRWWKSLHLRLWSIVGPRAVSWCALVNRGGHGCSSSSFSIPLSPYFLDSVIASSNGDLPQVQYFCLFCHLRDGKLAFEKCNLDLLFNSWQQQRTSTSWIQTWTLPRVIYRLLQQWIDSPHTHIFRIHNNIATQVRWQMR